MVNPFWSASATNSAILLEWLAMDPSPYLGLIAATLAYVLMRLRTSTVLYVAAFIAVSVPLSIWVWDLPFTGRVICWTFHDDRTFLKGRHLYAFAALLYIPAVWLLKRHYAAVVRAVHVVDPSVLMYARSPVPEPSDRK
jgi:hypothetical protein